MSQFAELERILSPDRVMTGESVARAYDCDAYTVERSKPTCVVLRGRVVA